MKDSDNIDELYQWVNGRYEAYTQDQITEDEYLADLEYYKQRLAKLETPAEQAQTQQSKVMQENPERESISPQRVRSTSIAGLRKKLMEEMKK